MVYVVVGEMAVVVATGAHSKAELEDTQAALAMVVASLAGSTVVEQVADGTEEVAMGGPMVAAVMVGTMVAGVGTAVRSPVLPEDAVVGGVMGVVELEVGEVAIAVVRAGV